MMVKAKTFDCVEMKRRAQERILAEYEERKAEFSSYCEFLQHRCKQSAWQSEFWAKLGRDKSGRTVNR